MENLIKIIEYINPAQLVAITVIMCFFIIDLIKKIDNINHRIDILEQKIDKLNDLLSQRIDNLYGFMLNLFQAKRNYDINNDKAA